MDIFLKVTIAVLITAIISLILSKQCPEISLLLTIVVCCSVVIVMVSYLQPVIEFSGRLVQLGQLSTDMLNVLLKVTGIGIISQIAGLICSDAGNQSLSKILQILTIVVILCVSVPLLEEVITLIENVMGDI